MCDADGGGQSYGIGEESSTSDFFFICATSSKNHMLLVRYIVVNNMFEDLSYRMYHRADLVPDFNWRTPY